MVTLMQSQASLPQVSVVDTAAVLSEVVAPTVSKGAIIRRPKVVGMAESLHLDTRAVRRMQRLRNKYGDGPLMLRMPGRNQAVILSPEHVWRVLNETPEPFATASWEKRQALSHFEPEVALISHGPERTERRRFNEQVLDTNSPMHRSAASFVATVNRHAEAIINVARERGVLTWDIFAGGWFQMVREVVFGPGARDDRELTDMIEQLRSAGNWAFLAPQQEKLREKFLQRIRRHLERAEEGSLAAMVARTPHNEITSPEQQVPQWLFAFDPAGMTTFRTLALLAAFPEHQERAQEEIRHCEPRQQPLPYLRSAVLESLRLLPTTPMVLRETTTQVQWDNGFMPARTSVLIFAPFFHRDNERLAYADRFVPDIWLSGKAGQWPLIPFSAGPAVCPGQQVVLLTTSAMLAALLRNRKVHLDPSRRLDPQQPLPGTLDNYSLRFILDD
jgi:cytochrome P450